MSAPLQGVRVLDFGHILAGPYCSRLLADLGADVVKVESRSRVEGMGRTRLGDDYKGRRDRSPHMLMTNRNRRSITLNLKTAGGVETARRLAGVSDVLVENFSAGTLDRLGLGYAELEPNNPRLVYLSLSGYGHEGPRRDWTSMNLNLQAYSGLMMITGDEGDPPTTIAASWNDYLGALHGCVAVLNALLEREQSGRGTKLDLSQFESSVSSLGALLLAASVDKTVPPRLGNRSEQAAPQGCYRCAGQDEWCAISVQTDQHWQALANIIGIHNVRYENVVDRLKHHDELDRIIEGWTMDRPDTTVESILRGVGVPAERMRRARDTLADEQTGRFYRPVEDPPGHQTLMAALPLGFSRSVLPALSQSPKVGEHTTDVLEEWLGLSAEEIEALEAEEALI
jgi:crotonobetainyl-CoA:carnitine CoA-transferase CaiB-like acyl-CoA transferase